MTPTSSSSGPAGDLPIGLVDLAARRAPRQLVWGDDLVRIAAEHRMTGLLWTWADANAPEGDVRSALALSDLRVQAHLHRVRTCLADCAGRLRAEGIDVATIKGVTAEARWYGRAGERLCSDVDLLLAPAQLGRAADAVAALQPDHPWIGDVDDLVSSGLQSITMRVDGLEVDLHFDLLKLGIPCRSGTRIWERTGFFALPEGVAVRVLDPTDALLHFLVHLNKDRFQRLSGYADVARLIAVEQVDWVRFRHLAELDGIETAVACALDVVLDELDLPWPPDVPRPHGPRAQLWRTIWPPRVRLRGREGRLRFRRRQGLLAFLARGRADEAIRWWIGDLVPPPAAVATRYGHIDGPYPWKLIRGRGESILEQRRQLRSLAARTDTRRTG